MVNVISGSVFACVIKRRCDEDSRANVLGVMLDTTIVTRLKIILASGKQYVEYMDMGGYQFKFN